MPSKPPETLTKPRETLWNVTKTPWTAVNPLIRILYPLVYPATSLKPFETPYNPQNASEPAETHYDVTETTVKLPKTLLKPLKPPEVVLPLLKTAWNSPKSPQMILRVLWLPWNPLKRPQPLRDDSIKTSLFFREFWNPLLRLSHFFVHLIHVVSPFFQTPNKRTETRWNALKPYL